MSFKKEAEVGVFKPQNEWQRDWDKRDWEIHDLELQAIDADMKELKDEYEFQARRDAGRWIPECGSSCNCKIIDGVKEHKVFAVTDPHQYQVNKWKLHKWQKWKMNALKF